MKKTALLIACIISIMLLGIVSASAADTGDIYYVTTDENVNTTINIQTVSGKNYLFLPSSADLSKLVLMSDAENKEYTISADKTTSATFGSETDILSLFNDVSVLNGEYKVKLASGDETKEIIIMKSENIKSLFITSEDPANKGRAWIDKSKDNKAKGNIVFVDADGAVINADEMTEIKARGNSTFTDFDKKAYQFKIKNKFNMTGDENNAQKKWVLLANAGDITLIHNSLVTTLAKDLGLPYTIDNTPVDLYYDGEYRGSYLLTDKVEVGEENLDIQDLDGIIEEDNEGTDPYENPKTVVKTTASKGANAAKENSPGSYKYVEGLKEPALEEGTKHHAYLLELEFIYRYPNEQSGFVTSRGQAVVTKNPEYLTKDTGAFISQFYQDFEDAVFSPNGYNEKTGKYYYEYCDLDSLVKIYLINEYTKNYDSYRSSTYFYLPEDEDIMYAGPIWDYDLCFTTGYDYNSQVAGNPENFWAATKYLASTLITIESFRDAVKEYLNSEDGIFYKAAEKMLGEDGNIMTYSQNVYASQRMNYKIWSMTLPKTAAFRCGDEETYENGIDFLLDFATDRLSWLSETTASWSGADYDAPMDPVKGEWENTERYHEPVTIKKIEPTCTKKGMTAGSVCKGGCGKVFVKREEIPATGHDYVAIETSSPTCTTEGVLTYTCSTCSDSYEEKIEMNEHDAVWEVTIPAGIGVDGKKELICMDCGAIIDEEVIPALEEPETEEPSIEESETEEESSEAVEEESSEKQEVHVHDYVAVILTPSTCTQDGLMVYTCACGETYDEVIPAIDHNGVWVVVTPAEIGIDGLRELVCTECSAILESEIIPAVEEESESVSEEDSSTDEETTAETTTQEPETEVITTEPSTKVPEIDPTTKEPVTEEKTTVEPTTKEPATDAPVTIRLGDVNLDKKITAADARFALRIAAKLEPGATNEQLVAADVIADGKITAKDARLILRVSAKLDKESLFGKA